MGIAGYASEVVFSDMKKILFLALCLFAISPLCLMAEEIAATDSRVTFLGRAEVENGALRFDWPSTYFRVAFKGKALSMRVSDNKRNFYAVWVDMPTSAEPTRIVEVKGNDTIIDLVLPSDVKKSKIKEHQVVIQKRTEAGCGTTTVFAFITDGQFVQAEPLKERQIEFIGDSYTCGYGVDAGSRRDPFTDETENASRTYASIVARYFNADYMTIAHSGRGICRNAGSNIPWEVMTDLYQYTIDRDSTTRWSVEQSPFRPAMTVIYLGTNDFSSSMVPDYNKFRKGYMRLLSYVKENYGEDHPVLCVASKTNDYQFRYVRDVVRNCGLKNVEWLGYCPSQHSHTDEDMGAGWHPNYNGQQKLAYSIIPYIATITGWGLQDMPVK